MCPAASLCADEVISSSMQFPLPKGNSFILHVEVQLTPVLHKLL